MPRIYLHLEGLAVLLLSLFAYYHAGGSWLLFALLLFVPDIAMVGYLVNVKVGSVVYNLVHNYISAILLCGVGYFSHSPLLLQIGMIWIAHIGMDRALGYGLKYPTQFKDTHLQRV